jgi:hypothetical protein
VTDLPKPLLAALGVLAEVRRLPAHAMNLGVTVLTASDKLRRDYTALAQRGEQVVTELFGGSETGDEPAVPAGPVVTLGEDEAVVVLDAVSHVEDPLDRPRSQPEPLPGYDGMTLGALRGRLRALTPDDLARVLRYEQAHRARPPVVTLVEHRLAKLSVE